MAEPSSSSRPELEAWTPRHETEVLLELSIVQGKEDGDHEIVMRCISGKMPLKLAERVARGSIKLFRHAGKPVVSKAVVLC